MTFHEVRLEKKYCFGATGGPMFKTTVMERSSGHEQRNIQWSQIRGRWDISYIGKEQTDTDALKAFFYARQGRAHGFRFKDWADYTLTRQAIGTTDGVTTTFQIYKRYSSGSINFDRPLTKIVANADAETDLRVWVNNVEIMEGVGAGQYAVNRNTGIITLGASVIGAGSPVSAFTVEAECEFDVPVRFDTDHFQTSIVNGDTTGRIYTMSSIPIVEIRDI